MNTRRSHLALLAMVLATLVGVGFLATPGAPGHRSLKKGLDLQGGIEIVLKAVPLNGHKLAATDLDRSVEIMRNRIDKLGVAEPIITKQGNNEIVIQLAGVHDVNKAAQIIGSTAQLALYDLEPALVPPSVSASRQPVAARSLYELLSRVQANAKVGSPSEYVLFAPAKAQTSTFAGKKAKTVTVWNRVGDPAQSLHLQPNGVAGLLDPYRGKLPAGDKILTVPHNTVLITCSARTAVACPGDLAVLPPVGHNDYYLFKHGPYPGDRYGPYPNMTGTGLNLGGTRQDFNPSGEAVVLMQFTGKGNKAFATVTKNEAIRGSIQRSAQHFAIVLDDELRSWPQIDYSLYPNGIDPAGTGAQITGMASLSEAKNLALVLQTGALPVTFVTLERTDVSATLGKDSLKQAWLAAIGGLVAVAVFLLLLYRFLGLVAVIGLAIYAAFMYAAILLLGVTLTLPGFAGLILTIGVAADANVVVFERIKEEVRAGSTVRKAVTVGYAKGFRTIIDANVVTAITALILFAVATAGVKGFALMLLIGTVVSLITAVAATRAMLGLLAGFRWFENPKFMGAHHSQRGRFLQIDFMARRKLWLALSGAVILISIGSLATRGLNLGIDFKGGVQVAFRTDQFTPISKVRAQTALIGHAKDAIVQGRGSSQNHGEDYKSFQIRLKKLSSGQQNRLSGALRTNVGAVAPGLKNVSSSFGQQIARSAIIAILFSLIVITLYITIRFKGLAFAVPVIVALLHDILITVGVYALTGREVTEATVAAVLTVLGYSIYDTIIIFDRIRENVPIMRHASIATIVNVSLWETIRRSLATTFITLLPVAALFLFGGPTLQDFAFALLIGVTSGAYSSIFIAAPLLAWWKDREPEYARRKAQKTPDRNERRALDESKTNYTDATEPGLEVTGAASSSNDGDPLGKRDARRRRRKSRLHGR